MTRIRIAPNGTIRGLWDDRVDWTSLGRVTVRRASHVEYCDRWQQWYVRRARPRSALRRCLQWLTGRLCGEILHWARMRQDALTWEQQHYGISGLGWKAEHGN